MYNMSRFQNHSKQKCRN